MAYRNTSTQDEHREKMYTIQDIQEIFQISHNTAYKLVNSRSFPKIKLNRRFYVPEKQLRRWIEQNLYKEIEI